MPRVCAVAVEGWGAMMPSMDQPQTNPDLLAAAKALLALELDQDGCTADQDDLQQALAVLRNAVQQTDPATPGAFPGAAMRAPVLGRRVQP